MKFYYMQAVRWKTVLNLHIVNKPSIDSKRKNDVEDKIFALTLSKWSSSGYYFWRQVFILHSLIKLLSNVPFYTGVQQVIFNMINVTYDHRKDCIVGF